MPAFGLALKNFVGPAERPDIDGLYAYADRAEALGFESLWAWDHVILGVEPAFPTLDAVGTLTAIAARTSRIKLGTGVLVLPLRNPTVAAKALGTLDVISKGRLILGVAAGWYAREFDAVGVPFKRRGQLFERNLEILTRLWTEDRVTLQVDELNLREAVMLPRPAQRPRPPILIGGYVDAVLRRVATRGEGVDQLRAHAERGVDRIVLIPSRYAPDQVEQIAREIPPRLTHTTASDANRGRR